MKTAALAFAAALTATTSASAQDKDLARFRDLYRELVEIDTTYSVGDCTKAATAMAARLKKAGYADKDVRVLVPKGHPRFGALTAIIPGSDKSATALLLLAHIDVVEAKREDWKRDPFKLVEEDGYFYGRGTFDDKAMAAVFVDSFIRYREEGLKPRRDIKLALTCGEETGEIFDGLQYLIENHRETVQAGMAINEGGSGRLDENGKHVLLEIQAGEKIYQDYKLEITNPGGHSSRPTKDNAIVRLSHALTKIWAYEFPVKMSSVTRGYFAAMSGLTPGPLAADMKALDSDNPPAAAVANVARDPLWNSMMRTTCVPTMVNAGHAQNALPQRATANVNCRILPGQTVEATKQKLIELAADKDVAITLDAAPTPQSPAPPISGALTEPARAVASKIWPGVPLVPTLSTGATDGIYTNAAGIPTYGMSGMFRDPDGNGVHGLNERIRVKSLYDGREFLHEIVKLYASGG